MGRPSKPVKTSLRAKTKKEKTIRVEVESKMQAGELPANPPEMLNEEQAGIYTWLYNTLQPTGYMSALDTEILIQGSIIMERLRSIDREINADRARIMESKYRTARDMYYKQFLKICEQLCMSPQARAKMGTLIANTKEADPLADILGAGK